MLGKFLVSSANGKLFASFGALAASFERREYVRWFFFAVGLFVLLVGLASALSSLAAYALPDDAANLAFAPAASLQMLPPPVASTTPLTPARLKIPSIGVNAAVESVGKKDDGSMATPSSFETVGWYKFGSMPGAQGSAVIDGHVNNALTKSGVFEHLSDVHVGDYVTVSDASGRTLVYVVYETDQYPATQEPPPAIFSGEGPSRLVLITCDGAWDDASHSYDKRFVVYARLSNR